MSKFFVELPTQTAVELASIKPLISRVVEAWVEKKPLSREDWIALNRVLTQAQYACELALEDQKETA